MKLTFTRQEIQAALLFTSTDETRYTITGLSIEARAGKLPTVAATDGRRLVALETAAEQREETAEDFKVIMRPDFAKAITVLSKAVGGKNNPWICLEIKPGSKRVMVEFIGADTFLESECGALIEGTFPDWRKVMPAKRQKRQPITDIALNAEFIGDFAKAAKLLEAESPLVQMNLVGKEQQVEVKIKGLSNFYGLVMQCKLDEATEYQPEFTAIVDAFPKQEPVEPEEEEKDEKDE